jgi:leucyl aminopeptidase
MKIGISKALSSQTTDIIIPRFETELLASTGNKTIDQFIKNRSQAKHFLGKTHEIMQGFLDDGKKTYNIIMLGLGEKKDWTAEIGRECGGLATKKLQALKITTVTLVTNHLAPEELLPVVEGLAIANYKIGIFKTDKKPSPLLTAMTVVTSALLQKKLDEIAIVAEHIHRTRDLINSPADTVYPQVLAETAAQLARQYKLKIETLTEKEIVKKGLNLLWAVGKGSVHKPRLITLHYRGGKSGEAPILLVGKGITFDSGGYNLKPTNYIEEMYMDMAGAATVLGTITAASALKLAVNITIILAAAENLVSSNAFKPSDIITAFNGKTVEITNTDAEGRLVLADAISYGIKQYKPRAILDLATLTGACMVALGDRYSGVFSNSETLLSDLKAASVASAELIWELPMHPDYDKRLKSEKADMINCDVKTRLAGASTAAAFIKRFVEDIPWAHLDIAGTAFGSAPRPYDHNGASAYGIRLLLSYLQAQATKPTVKTSR